MGATSDDLMDIARAGAERIEMPENRVSYPSFSDIEEQCASEYDELLDALHDDELFAPADVQRQEEIVQRLKTDDGYYVEVQSPGCVLVISITGKAE